MASFSRSQLGQINFAKRAGADQSNYIKILDLDLAHLLAGRRLLAPLVLLTSILEHGTASSQLDG